MNKGLNCLYTCVHNFFFLTRTKKYIMQAWNSLMYLRVIVFKKETQITKVPLLSISSPSKDPESLLCIQEAIFEFWCQLEFHIYDNYFFFRTTLESCIDCFLFRIHRIITENRLDLFLSSHDNSVHTIKIKKNK